MISLNAQPAIALEEHASGFDRPVVITHANDARIFVVEQDGVIKIIEDGTVLATPFLDIDARVRSVSNEQGLLGLAFHPNYAENGFFFVYYTDNSGDTQVSRFSVDSDDPNVADANSELKILDADQPYSNHNGGSLQFSPIDGYLYIGLGDGGSGGDPDGNGQNRMTFLGKILRIDVNNSDVTAPYAIPESNPFAADDFTLDEIWAIGVRNPWRFSFDRQTGDFWIGDVGQNAWEEIDFQPASSVGGENYGWRCYEGFHTYNTNQCDGMDAYDSPVFEYPNSFSGGCSVTGGYIYRGTEFPALNGYYLFADYCLGDIMSLKLDDDGNWEHADLLETPYSVSAFGEDAAGELYMTNLSGGRIYKIIEPCANFAVATTFENETCEGQMDGIITLDTPSSSAVSWDTGSSDNPLTGLGAGVYIATIMTTEGCETEVSVEIISDLPMLESPSISQDVNTLSVPEDYTTYQWYFNGNLIPDETESTYMMNENGTYFVIVSNENGCQAFSDILPLEFVNTLEALSINSLEISPIPFKNNFQLNLNSATSGNYTFTVLTANGEEVLVFEEHISSLFNKTVDMKDWSAGSYFLVVERDGKRIVKQIVKQ